MPVLERHRAEGQLHKAVLEADVQRLLNDEVLRLIREKTGESVLPLDSHAGAPTGESTAAFAATNGIIDTTMEVRVVNAGLSGGRDRSSPLAAFLEVRVRLARVSDGADLYAHTWVPRSGSATFEKWSADEAQAMRQELPRMIAPLAGSVVDEVFLLYDPKQAGKRK
jgi:hypothetical protein